MNYVLRLQVVCLSALLVLFAACKKDKDASTSEGAAAAASNAFGSLPKDSTILIGINLEKGMKSDLAKPYLEKLRGNLPAKYTEVKDKCGIDVLEEGISSIVVAAKDPNDQKSVFIAVTTKVDKSKIGECAGKMGGKVSESGKLTTYEVEGEKTVVHWASDKLMIMSGVREPTEDDFKPVFDGGADKSEALKDIIGKANKGAVFWGVGKVPAGAGLPAQGVDSFYGSVDVDSGIAVAANIVFDNDDNAKGMKAMLDENLQGASMFIGEAAKEIKVSQEGAEVKVAAKFTEKQVKDIATTVGGMMGVQL